MKKLAIAVALLLPAIVFSSGVRAQAPADPTQIPQDQLVQMRKACDLVCTQVWNGTTRGPQVSNQKWSCTGDNAAGCMSVIGEFSRRQEQAYGAAAQAALSKMLKDNGLK